MTDIDENGSPKKAGGRKKAVDLKAVASLPEEGETHEGALSDKPVSLFIPDSNLIEETTRIKSQRDLLLGRVQKMNQTRERVSKSVYEKVARDYRMQLENISQLLGEKKEQLSKELKKLYMLREKQSMEVNRHREILEEARFRHYLDEFSEEQYKEVEEFESKEITHLQSELAQLHSFIRVHEELFDPEDLGLTPRPREIPKEEPTRTLLPPAIPAPQKTALQPESPPDTFSDKTPLPEKKPLPSHPPEVKIPAEPTSDEEFHPDTFSGQEEASYFETFEPSPAPDQKALEVETAKTNARPKEPESILDVIEDMPLESEVSETVSKTGGTPLPVPPKPQAPGPSPTGVYKLLFTEVEAELDLTEYALKENVSIGRSPSNDLVLKAPKVSRQHAAINKYKDKFVIIDLKSSNGVFVNGKKVDEYTLEDGDTISIGGYRMLFKKG